MQLSQACSSHRCAALTGYASLTGVQLTGHVAHRVSDLGKKRIFGKKKVFGKTSLYPSVRIQNGVISEYGRPFSD
jgi:hypothetical protein